MTAIANREQFDAWNGDSGSRWVATADQRDAVLAPIADLLLDHAAIETGQRVLDIGCGCGATTIAASNAAGPSGAGLGADLSAPMLDVARERARSSGLEMVSFVQADVQTDRLVGPFDVAISRFGTMFFSDPIAAFTNVAAHLSDGGRLCIATWQPLVANEWLVVPGAALLEFVSLADSTSIDAPGMFAQSDPAVIDSTLTSAGFRDIDTTAHTLELTLGSTIEEAVEYLADSGPGRVILEAIPAEQHHEALARVGRVLAAHKGVDGSIQLDAGVLITAATR